MLRDHLKRGLAAGAVAGTAYGAFVALAGGRLVAVAEMFEADHAEHAHAAASAGLGTVVDAAAGALLGVLLGALVFGVGYYLLEPALPGTGDAKSYLLAAAGFVTFSGAPWLAVPPQPPGVERAVPTDVGIAWYGGMMFAGALACGLAALAYRRLRSRSAVRALVAAALPFVGLLALSTAAPAAGATGDVPSALIAAFRWTVVFGQLGLWFVLASVHAWLDRRAGRTAPARDGVTARQSVANSAD